jgi:hypothetical protein
LVHLEHTVSTFSFSYIKVHPWMASEKSCTLKLQKTLNIGLHQLQPLPVSLWVSTCCSLSPLAPEAISVVFACSVYTVQPPDRCHTHSLLCLWSKVVYILLPFIPYTFMSRVTESYQSYPTSPSMTPDIHSTIPYSPTLTSLVLPVYCHCCCRHSLLLIVISHIWLTLETTFTG